MRCAVGLIVGLVLAFLSSCLSARAAHAEPPKLETLANDPAAGADKSRVDELAAAADAMSEGYGRLAADLYVGEAYRGRFHAPDRAIHHLRRAAESAVADPLTKRVATGALVDVLVETGARNEALAIAERSGDAQLVKRALAAVRRQRVHWTSLFVVAVFGLLAGASVVRAARAHRLAATFGAMRKFGGIALGVALWLGAGGALLARAYDASDPAPFIRLAFVVLPIALLARAWGLVGAPTRAARAGRAAISAQAALAASFLVLESVDPRLLAGFGL